MNIVFFMQDTGAVYGAERATIDLACGLRNAGDTPHFFLMEETRLDHQDPALQNAIRAEGLPYATFNVTGRISRSMARSVRMAFLSMGGDVLHVIGYKANLHAWLSGIRPRIATVHGWLFRNDPKERLYDAIDRWCLNRCDHVICLSSYYEQLLLSRGLERKNITRIPSGLREVPGDDAVRPRDRHRPFTFGMMGRFSEEKNHRLFLRAAKTVNQQAPEVRFRIAGQGPLEREIRRDADELGLASVVDFCGYTSVNSFMESIDAYVICSKIENLPYSILEAMAWARPVVATKAGGMPDLIEDGKTGCLVDGESEVALSGAMLTLARDSARSIEMGQVGRHRLRSMFTIEKSVAEHQRVYRQMLEVGND